MSRTVAASQPSLRAIVLEVRPLLQLAISVIVGLVSGTLMIAPLATDALAAIGLATSALIIVYSGLLSVVAVAMVNEQRRPD